MIGIVIVAHGQLAKEYLLAVEHVVGKQQGIVAVPVEADHDRTDKQNEISKAVEDVDTGSGVVVLTDIFGGSPSNLSLPACQKQNRLILSGVNLPMLIKLARSRSLTLSVAVDLALKAGRKYMNSHCFSVESLSV